MNYSKLLQAIERGEQAPFFPEARKQEYAQQLDSGATGSHFRDEFAFPTKRSMKDVVRDENASDDDTPLVYFCGNSPGLQPKSLRKTIDNHLDTWAS